MEGEIGLVTTHPPPFKFTEKGDGEKWLGRKGLERKGRVGNGVGGRDSLNDSMQTIVQV